MEKDLASVGELSESLSQSEKRSINTLNLNMLMRIAINRTGSRFSLNPYPIRALDLTKQ